MMVKVDTNLQLKVCFTDPYHIHSGTDPVLDLDRFKVVIFVGNSEHVAQGYKKKLDLWLILI